MTRMQVTRMRSDKKTLKKTSENQRLKIRFISVPTKD
jgi:hypothetical protein